VPDQVYQTNILDSDKHVLTIGAGYQFKDPWDIVPNGMSVDAFFQYQFLVPRDTIKKSSVDPVGDYRITGGAPIGGLSLKFFL
jgi:hypothetical protein